MNVWDFVADVRNLIEDNLIGDLLVIQDGLDLFITDSEGDEFVIRIDTADPE